MCLYRIIETTMPSYTFSEDQIVYAVRTQLTWTHIRSLMFIDDQLKRELYVEMCRLSLSWIEKITKLPIKKLQYLIVILI